jgi:hypothetical protein
VLPGTEQQSLRKVAPYKASTRLILPSRWALWGKAAD